MGYSKLKNQQLAFDKLSRLKVGALFMEMGTGKTKVALDLTILNQIKLIIFFGYVRSLLRTKL